MLECRDNPDGANVVEVIELTKRQKGLITSGGVEILGRKLRPQDDPAGKGWAMAWSELDAQRALDDLMTGEPCIYVTPDAVFVSTRSANPRSPSPSLLLNPIESRSTYLSCF